MSLKISNIKPIARSVSWMSGSQSFGEKIKYFPEVFASYFRFYILGKGRVKYLGENFYFDSRVTPLGLMLYPEEIDQIIKAINIKEPKVLDIGANIGQFAISFAELSPKAKIDSFEPNPIAFELLDLNAARTERIKTYCHGVGEKGKHKLYYDPSRSVNGSLIRRNATYRNPDHKSETIEVDIIDNVSKVTGRSEYDLIKEDVEGNEFDTVKHLKGLKTKYLYIEITNTGRQKNYQHSELFIAIAESLGTYNVLYTTKATEAKFEAMFAFDNK